MTTESTPSDKYDLPKAYEFSEVEQRWYTHWLENKTFSARMDEGKRSKVMAEFAKESPTVAAGLLERLRTRGVAMSPDAGSEPSPASANAANPAANPG